MKGGVGMGMFSAIDTTSAMAKTHPKPRLVISMCFFKHTRYDGGIISSDLVKALEKHCEFVKVCPEVEIGLPIPREPIDVFLVNDEYKLMNKLQTIDLTEKMNNFAKEYSRKIREDYFKGTNRTNGIDGMILKSKSPSCGLNDAKLYSPSGRVISKTAGLFAKKMVEQFPEVIVESEMRLTNEKIKIEFLTFIFVHSKFREIKTKREFVEFHSENKYLFLTKNEKMMREMGKIVAVKEFDDNIIENYGSLLRKTLKTPLKSSKIVNTWLHIYGHFKDKISVEEKAYFGGLIQDFINGIVSMHTINAVLKSWAIRLNEKYILSQTFFEPFPKELINIK